VIIDEKGELVTPEEPAIAMTIDVKIRLGLFLVSAAISVFAGLAMAHGLFVGPLDGIGGTTPP
jgi:hypothetical protein